MFEFDLVDNALHSLSEAMAYYNEADEGDNADKFKFCILLSCHCAELLLKEILYRNHPSLVFEDIDKIKDMAIDENIQTVGYRLSIRRVKTICRVDLRQYEQYLEELGRIRNRVQHYRCSIDGAYYKNLMAKAFSAIEYIFLDVLHLKFEDYSAVIDARDVAFLHEDAATFAKRKEDIQKEFSDRRALKFVLEYDNDKKLSPPCPSCGTLLLAKEDKIRCKMCGAEFVDLDGLHASDGNCIITSFVLRELGKRKSVLKYPVYECTNCEHETVVFVPPEDVWQCLNCNSHYSGMAYCDECGDPIPNEQGITKLAMSDYDTEDYKYLCPSCAKQAANDERYMGYNIE